MCNKERGDNVRKIKYICNSWNKFKSREKFKNVEFLLLLYDCLSVLKIYSVIFCSFGLGNVLLVVFFFIYLDDIFYVYIFFICLLW